MVEIDIMGLQVKVVLLDLPRKTDVAVNGHASGIVVGIVDDELVAKPVDQRATLSARCTPAAWRIEFEVKAVN
jgi:hypothetical protein